MKIKKEGSGYREGEVDRGLCKALAKADARESGKAERTKVGRREGRLNKREMAECSIESS